MRQKPGTKQSHGEKVVKDIRRATRKQYTAEEKISRLQIVAYVSVRISGGSSFRSSPVRRAISRIGKCSRCAICLMIFRSPMWITPLPPAAQCLEGRVT